ncbi:hypothetical protein [Pontibacter sp. G13]|uniref:hypothetical protein n=1 Tax=Pontibacter sp. G13 TaxID=3074898 RepID=UPI00288B0B3C|nr:hypothetical protein [Pontibacter sp. G13]WNJ20384.1 hypothetical protein RJD25_07875 [Pontibacter sp. G13]
MIWKKPEMVIVTITFSVAALILFIVGTSCLFSYFDWLDTSKMVVQKEKFKIFAMLSGLLLFSLILAYVALRMLLVRVVTDEGIVINDKFLRIPDIKQQILWEDIVDYYLVSDYPNVVFTLIVQKDIAKFDRFSLRVPVYIRDDFEDLVETKMYHARDLQRQSDMSSRKFYEN